MEDVRDLLRQGAALTLETVNGFIGTCDEEHRESLRQLVPEIGRLAAWIWPLRKLYRFIAILQVRTTLGTYLVSYI